MQIKNSRLKYGVVSSLFHWIMALIIIGLIVVGLYMVNLPISNQKFKLFGYHKEFGLLILFLVLFRLSWRFANETPELPSHMPYWQVLSARLVHFTFYIFMFAMPITGWLTSSATGVSVSFFGLFTMPDLVSPDPTLRVVLTQTHHLLAFILIGLICIHVSAVGQHYLIYKDNILRRIL